MPTELSSAEYRATRANLSRSEFRDVNLSQAVFNDVSLRGATFENVAFTNATIRNACMGNLSIEDAGLEGKRINGILVTELLRVYRESNP